MIRTSSNQRLGSAFYIKILDWQFTIIKIEIEKLKFTIVDKYMANM